MARPEGDGRDLVLFFDANTPELRHCKRGCSTDGSYMCRHRFGTKMRLICDQDIVSLVRMLDLQVFLYFVARIERFWMRKGRVRNKRFAIVTHDPLFVCSAKGEHTTFRNMRSLPLTFGHDSITFNKGRKDEIPVTVFVVPARSASRDHDLREILKFARETRVSIK